MTDNEIIKVLECHSNARYDQNSCDFCPILNHCDCGAKMSQNALDFINRQKAEIENLKDILYDADGVNLVNYWHQQCQIAENGCRNFEAENNKLKAEIERLEDLNKCYYTSCQQIAKSNHEIKAEAVNEFAERLKEHKIDVDVSFGYGKEVYTEAVAVIEIDNLVKEMEGES